MISFSGMVLFLLVLMSMVTRGKPFVAPVTSISMTVENLTGRSIDLFWVNNLDGSGDLVPQTSKPLRNSSQSQINSYEGHVFRLKFHNTDYSSASVDFAKLDVEERIKITYDEVADILHVYSSNYITDLKDSIRGASIHCIDLKDTEDFVDCMSDELAEAQKSDHEKHEKLTKYRDLMADRLRNYTCEDMSMSSTKPVHSYYTQIAGERLKVDELLKTDHAKIWTVNDFVKPEECEILRRHGKPLLQRATVAAQDGTSTLSESRKANQASYNFVPGNSSVNSDPLWPLYKRVVDLVNYHGGYKIRYEGQEYFTIIQYDVGDEYAPHCDGQCEGAPYFGKGRVATAILYCELPEKGGSTTFTKADVFVRPAKGMATFFSYKGSDGIMDEGYTEHSGCPVRDGSKWITAAWLREGVTLEDPADLYDPTGRLVLGDPEEEENDSSVYIEEDDYYDNEDDEGHDYSDEL